MPALSALAVVVLLLVSLPRVAHAGDEAQSAKDREEERPHTEVDPIPLVGGDTDIGWGGGALVDIARHDTGYRPFRWSLELSGLVTFKPPPSGGGNIQTPYQDYYARLRFPHLLGDQLSLDIRPEYSSEAALKYYGMGNASQVTPFPSLVDPYYEYGRIHPTLLVEGRLRMAGHLFVVVANSLRYNILDVRPDTRLATRNDLHAVPVRAGRRHPPGLRDPGEEAAHLRGSRRGRRAGR